MQLDKKSTEVGNVLDVEALKAKISQECTFISGVMDRIPTLQWRGTTGDLDRNSDDEDGTDVINHNTVVKHQDGQKGTSRAKTVEELQDRLNALRATKQQGYKAITAKNSLKNRLKKKKKAEERNKRNKAMKTGKQQSKSSKTGEGKPDVKPVKPVFNSGGKMVFSKFDFSDVGPKEKKKKELKDPKKILENLKEQKETLRKLQSEGQIDKALEIKRKEAWSKALKKAEGVKIKDDPELLMKSVQREEARKKKSAQKWKSREKTVKKGIEDRQKKREANIQARKDLVKKQKKMKAIKKGRVIPGF